MNNNADMITIFSGSENIDNSRGASRGISKLASSVSKTASEVAVSTVQDNLSQFISAIDKMFGNTPKTVGGLKLDHIEIHAEIDGKGKVGISAIGGAELSAKSGIKFVLSRKL